MAGDAGNPLSAIDFDRDIRPVLADACYACHGPNGDRRRAGLRLDTREGLFAPTRDASDPEREPGMPRRIVVPGEPGASELARRVLAEDEDERMPPRSHARKLSAEEKERLRAWIEMGAPWDGHWSFLPIRAVEPPAVHDAAWCRNEIDRFVLAGIEARGTVEPGGAGARRSWAAKSDSVAGQVSVEEIASTSALYSALAPAPEAGRRTLIRRLSLDLTGLPPTPAETAAYLADASPDAYERLVDRFLGSPAFGEHMAAAWLEVARYADSNGFQLDPDRTAWPWRDWVVRAFNANMPYNRFIAEQIAGDLIPGATAEQVLATAFNRNHPINGEGGREIEESRIDYVHDRVDATSEAFLGLTMACAQCHDHKYDPVTQLDYYRFFAFFNSVDEDGAGDKGDMPPLMAYRDPGGRDLKVMVMRDRAEPRQAQLLVRGEWDHPGGAVDPATPGSLPSLDAVPRNRLGLALWIVNGANPLTPRVAVNRLWQQVFGQGLVRTPDNFGVQGEHPTHPELLDWLAARFVEWGWDTKAMLRLMVTSATYRQSSACAPALLELDPENRRLARAPRYRLAAGVIRDQALAASALLVRKLGGPPVKPYHPAGVWEDVSFGRLKYAQGSGEDLYRRSLYTFWRRTAPPADMFDVSQRQRCSVRVIRTNTPLQALILLNDPAYAEAAAALAERAMREGGATDAGRLAWGFEAVLARPPRKSEAAVLGARLVKLREFYAQHPAEARAAACAGDRPDPPESQWTEVGAYAGVMTVILNLDETLTRE